MSRNNRGLDVKPGRLLLILLGICAFLIIISSVSSSINNTLRNGFNHFLMPFQKGMNAVGGFCFDGIENISELKEAGEENEALREELAVLRAENARLKLETTELASCRELLAMQAQYPELQVTGAHIIGKNSGNWFKTLLIDKGTEDGLAVNMNVIADGGLVGIITSVGSHYATVSTIMDDGRQVAVMAASSHSFGSVAGDLMLDEEGKLLLQNIAKDAEFAEGEMVVTSNVSDLYMPGILIGYASDITIDSNNLTKSGFCIPVVDFSKLDNVLVVTSLKETGD